MASQLGAAAGRLQKAAAYTTTPGRSTHGTPRDPNPRSPTHLQAALACPWSAPGRCAPRAASAGCRCRPAGRTRQTRPPAGAAAAPPRRCGLVAPAGRAMERAGQQTGALRVWGRWHALPGNHPAAAAAITILERTEQSLGIPAWRQVAPRTAGASAACLAWGPACALVARRAGAGLEGCAGDEERGPLAPQAAVAGSAACCRQAALCAAQAGHRVLKLPAPPNQQSGTDERAGLPLLHCAVTMHPRSGGPMGRDLPCPPPPPAAPLGPPAGGWRRAWTS